MSLRAALGVAGLRALPDGPSAQGRASAPRVDSRRRPRVPTPIRVPTCRASRVRPPGARSRSTRVSAWPTPMTPATQRLLVAGRPQEAVCATAARRSTVPRPRDEAPHRLQGGSAASSRSEATWRGWRSCRTPSRKRREPDAPAKRCTSPRERRAARRTPQADRRIGQLDASVSSTTKAQRWSSHREVAAPSARRPSEGIKGRAAPPPSVPR